MMKSGFIFRQRRVEPDADGQGSAAGDPATVLSEVGPGFRGRILHPNGVEVPLRLREMGFVPGTSFAVLRQGPLGDPLEIELRGYRICLRRSDLSTLRVEQAPPAEPGR